MTPFAVAGIQQHISAESNIAAMEARLKLLLHLYPWVEMVMWSELAVFGPHLHHAQRLPGPAEEAFRVMARRHKVWLLPGSLLEKRDGLIYNTTPVISPDGEVVCRYRKMFPFLPLEEGVTPGEEFCVFDVPDVGKFAVLNCYDLWFPETARTVTAMGAEVILHPVMTHTVDRDVDLNIAKASAAIFQAYVFDINGLAVGGNGQSCVVDPAGRVLHQAGQTDEMIPVEIDLDQVRQQRRRGMRNMGQPLKSFRDSRAHFEVYDPTLRDYRYLDTLGPLAKPERLRSPAGRVALEPVEEPQPAPAVVG